MKATEFKIKVTNTKTKESITIKLSDLKGYEGEDCGVFIDTSNSCIVDSSNWDWVKVTNKSGYGDTEIDWNLLDFEYVP